MATHIYPFIKDVSGTYRPMIPVNIINPHEKINIQTYALLDTGADDCVFPKFIAERTKHNLKGVGVSNHVMQGVGQHKVEVWKHTFKIELMSPDRASVIWKSKEVLVGCLEHDSAPTLLGWSNFMSNFKITFNYPTKRILIVIE